MKLRAELENGVIIEGKHRTDIEAGLDGWESPVIRVDFVDDNGGDVICPAEVPEEWRATVSNRERLTIDRPNLTNRLYDDYCDSELVQQTEDVLSARDISRIAKEQGVAWWNVKNEDEVFDLFWEVVEVEHWDGL